MNLKSARTVIPTNFYAFFRQRLSVAILRASVHCVRGARKKLAPLHLDDGAALPLFSYICFDLSF